MKEKKDDLRVRRTYKLLSESLIKLMSKKPFEKISVTDICNEAMVHRATFYLHFEDKYDLLKYCFEGLRSAFEKEELKEVSFDGYKDYYMRVAADIIGELSLNKDICRAIIRKNNSESILTNMEKALEDSILIQLKRCENKGLAMPVPVEFLTCFYAGACMNVITRWIENDMPYSAEEALGYLSLMIKQLF